MWLNRKRRFGKYAPQRAAQESRDDRFSHKLVEYFHEWFARSTFIKRMYGVSKSKNSHFESTNICADIDIFTKIVLYTIHSLYIFK